MPVVVRRGDPRACEVSPQPTPPRRPPLPEAALAPAALGGDELRPHRPAVGRPVTGVELRPVRALKPARHLQAAVVAVARGRVPGALPLVDAAPLRVRALEPELERPARGSSLALPEPGEVGGGAGGGGE